jgi:GNAT superfamily N-acetyltransferase
VNYAPPHYLSLRNTEIIPHLETLGRLRLQVFREFPYLYDGTIEDEQDYLRTYALAPSSLIALAFVGDEAIGATTCVRLSEAEGAFRQCFDEAGIPAESICYFGESVLLPSFRGRGIGKAFCQKRLEHAKALGCTTAAFCAVDREENHPLRPEGYRPLDEFWRSQGFMKYPELKAEFTWKEVCEDSETPKTLTFWLKP